MGLEKVLALCLVVLAARYCATVSASAEVGIGALSVAPPLPPPPSLLARLRIRMVRRGANNMASTVGNNKVEAMVANGIPAARNEFPYMAQVWGPVGGPACQPANVWSSSLTRALLPALLHARRLVVQFLWCNTDLTNGPHDGCTREPSLSHASVHCRAPFASNPASPPARPPSCSASNQPQAGRTRQSQRQAWCQQWHGIIWDSSCRCRPALHSASPARLLPLRSGSAWTTSRLTPPAAMMCAMCRCVARQEGLWRPPLWGVHGRWGPHGAEGKCKRSLLTPCSASL